MNWTVPAVVATALMIAASGPSVAQAATDTTVQTASPSGEVREENLTDFDFMVETLRRNYAGWDTKVTAETTPALDALTARLRLAAATADDAQLDTILREYIAFFRDRHVQVGPTARPAAAADETTEGPAVVYPTRDWDEAEVRARLEALGADRRPIEGIWRIGGDRYRIGVLRTDDTAEKFEAVVLTTSAEGWSPGQIKAELTGTADGAFSVLYQDGNHAVQSVTATVLAEGVAVALSEYGTWEREVPAVADPDIVARLYPSGDMFLKPLSPQTLWLRLPDFDASRAEPLKALFEANAAALATTPNLVIDLRENGGGSDFVYDPVTALMYTRPIYSIGVEIRSTPENIRLRQATADRIRQEAPEGAAQLDEIVALMQANPDQYFRPHADGFSIDARDAVLPFPKRIAVLIDGAGSSGEQFLLEARQSRKVTLFGKQNSAGVLDFANVESTTMPSGRFGMAWATSRSLRLPGDPVDPDGIAPDIRIPDTVEDPVTFVRQWLERQVD